MIYQKQRFRINHQNVTLLGVIPSRDKIKIGIIVQIIQKHDQRSGKLNRRYSKKNSYFK